MEKYSILQQKPTIQQEFNKLLINAIETAQSLISFVPPMVIDCLPNPDFASKAYPSLQGEPTNYVITQPALFFSYEAGGDKINGKCELLPPESCCFSRNWSKKDGVQVFKKETATQTELTQLLSLGFPQRGHFINGNLSRREGHYRNGNSSKKNESSQLNASANQQHGVSCPRLPSHIRPIFSRKNSIETYL